MSYCLLLVNFVIKGLRVMKENVEGADGTVWRRGRAQSTLPIKPPFLQKCLRSEGRGDLAHLIWVPQLPSVGSVPCTLQHYPPLTPHSHPRRHTIIGSILQMRKLRFGEMK